ncbi:MAG: hydroxymethylbilane synthase [Marinifilaceae bacterium]|jgi:hydroxymethylbilane synthase|nr:hydroxymethylbilane synthase [Marinifilaceae bacterium]
MNKTIIVATRPSQLAYTQTKQTVELLAEFIPEFKFEIKKISTKGDKDQKRSLSQFSTTGLFVKELEQAMYDGEADIAIHSLKDVPSVLPEDMELVCFPEREDAQDILVTRESISDLKNLKENAIIGTGSPRRILQLKNIRSDFKFKEIRGNIDTRLKKLCDGHYDAIVLAKAGVNRLGLKLENFMDLDKSICIPAPGQAALAIEIKTGDNQLRDCIRRINSTDTELCVLVERTFMRIIEGGCKFPLAVHAVRNSNNIMVNYIVGDLNSERYTKDHIVLNVDTALEDSLKYAQQLRDKCVRENIICNSN